jgi:hypothetical protein
MSNSREGLVGLKAADIRASRAAQQLCENLLTGVCDELHVERLPASESFLARLPPSRLQANSTPAESP